LFNQDGRWAAVNYQQQEVHWLIGSIKSAAAALLKKKKVPSAGAEEQMGDDQSAIGELRNLVFMDSKHRELDKKRWEQKLKEAEKDKADRYRECVHVGLA